MNHILLADDDVELCNLLTEYLSPEGFEIETAHDGDSALEMARNTTYDLIVLDVMMPKKNGFDVLRNLRKSSLTPVLMLTAKGDDVDSVLGLELGADDYLPKPCNPRVLLARIRAILRRIEAHSANNEQSQAEDLIIDNIEINPSSRSVLLNGDPVVLTSTEYSILEFLARNAGNVTSKETLSEIALGRKLTQYDRSLDMHISNLRKKLGPLNSDKERIQTIRGVGYMYTLS